MKRGRIPRCHRCNAELPCIEITALNDLERQYAVTGECACPRPICPFCLNDLTVDKCWTVDCFMCGEVVPAPIIA
jgi:hypothetical protein